MLKHTAILTTAALVFALAFSLLMALFVAGALESRSARHVARALNAAGLGWAEVTADGLLVTLAGTAPTEAMRFRAATLAGSTVGTSRVIDRMEVTPARALTAPRFSLEFLRNDDGISVIGLVPAAWDSRPLLDLATLLAPEDALTNMIETADFAIPDHWPEALDFGMVALRLLPRSKISLATDGIQVTAISDSPAQKRHFDSELGRNLPAAVPVIVQISAPRPVIAPFTLRFVTDAEGPRFDACAAETERARSRIINAARRAGLSGMPACTLGLGSPSPRWAEAAEVVIAAVAELGAATVTISDVDVTLIAESSVSQADFDRVIGEATSKLPDVFSLKATLTPPPQPVGTEGPAQFSATRSPEGQVQLRGRLSDERMRDAVEAYARARFGARNVYVATRLDEGLPPGWGVRVLAGLAALAEMNNGSVQVEPDTVALRGTTGNAAARAEVSRLLSDRLGQGAGFSVEVTYDERLDPARGLPTPEECLAQATGVLERNQITFAPNAVAVEGEAFAVVRNLVEVLADCGPLPLEIGGHTDSQGREELNLRLSQQRADAVLSALAMAGADTSGMTARGYGPTEPLADNATEEGRVANRRIAVKLLGAAASAPAPAASTDPANAAPATEPPPRPEERGPEVDPSEEDALPEEENGEPMGEAGDLILDADGEAQDELAETEAPVAADEPAPPAATPAPAAPEIIAAQAPSAASAEPGTAPSVEEITVDWQDDPAHNALRPERRPEEREE